MKEALINELKGNLFEYLIGLNLAKIFQIEPIFHYSFSGDLKQKLINYEAKLLKIDPWLFKKLPFLSRSVAEKITSYLPPKIDNILIIGMEAFKYDLNEADILVLTPGGSIPLSVKLSKENSFVNTKSAGVKSFISRYFPRFDLSSVWQNELNVVVDLSFENMARKLYRIAGLKYVEGFCPQWSQAGYSHLPGKLNMEMKKIVRSFYFDINAKIHQIFVKMERLSPTDFNQSLNPLLGFGDKKIIRVTCYHGQRSEKYQLIKIAFFRAEDFQEVLIGHLNPGIGSFEINIPGRILQVRVKPMNVFTTPAMKINCATKELL